MGKRFIGEKVAVILTRGITEQHDRAVRAEARVKALEAGIEIGNKLLAGRDRGLETLRQENERLRADHERMRQELLRVDALSQQRGRDLTEAEQESERLRAALKRIASQKLGDETWSDLLVVAEGCIEEARAALGDQQ